MAEEYSPQLLVVVTAGESDCASAAGDCLRVRAAVATAATPAARVAPQDTPVAVARGASPDHNAHAREAHRCGNREGEAHNLLPQREWRLARSACAGSAMWKE